MASVDKNTLKNSDYEISETQIPYFYREIPEKDLTRENENWIEFNYIDKSAYFLLSKSYLQLDVQICNRDNSVIGDGDTCIPISNGFARFNNIEFYLEDRKVSFTNTENMHVQHILNIGKHSKDYITNILEGMDAEIDTFEGGIASLDEVNYFNVQSSLTVTGNFDYTANVNPALSTFLFSINFLVYPEIDKLGRSFVFREWCIKILSGQYSGFCHKVEFVDVDGNYVRLSISPTVGNAFNMINDETNLSLSLFPVDERINSKGLSKRFNKYKNSRIVRLILPFNESNLDLLGYPKFLTNLKWKLRLQKGESSDIIFRNRVDNADNGLTTNLHNYRIRNAKCYVAIANTRRMIKSDVKLLEKSNRIIELDHLIPFITHRSFSSRQNTFSIREFQKTDKPMCVFFFMQSGNYSDVRNNEFSNPLIYDHMLLESINLEVNGFTMYEEDLRCRFYENNFNPLASDAFNNCLDYDIAFKYFLSAYKDNNSSIIDKNQYRNIYPIFYFDLERIIPFEFNTDVPVSLTIRYKLGVPRDANGEELTQVQSIHEAYALVMIKQHITIDTTPNVAKIKIN